jgi:hypothetical protein
MRALSPVLAVSLLALAAGGRAADAAPAPTPNAARADEVRTIVGQIVSVDAAKGTFVVGESVQSSRPQTSQKVRESVTLTVDAKTQLFRGKSPVAQTDLHPKDHVVVHYVLTPQGARALTCRISDAVARPTPTASVSAGAPGSAVAAAPSPN